MTGDIGVIGLAVMGQNLILNMNDHGFKVIAYNRTTSKVEEFLSGPAKDTEIEGAHSITELCERLKRPRKVMLMVKAGDVVDQFIEQLIPHLEPGDIIIDGGNSHYPDTNRRVKSLADKGIHYLGTGVSGGEEGARFGPSIMPGGSAEAWPHLQPIFQSIAAKTDDGQPCCDWVGKDGAGHFVKMVHNGIEYGDMQLICESYHFMKQLLGLSNEQMHQVFADWNDTELNSYLIEITRDILGYKNDNHEAVIDLILDTAGQKGTGKWTAIHALDKGIPLTLIAQSVFTRTLSALKEQRIQAAQVFDAAIEPIADDPGEWIDALRKALLASKIISYAQGFMLMREASEEYGWDLNYGGVALMWRGGCIIRSAFLDDIHAAFSNNPELVFLGTDHYFKNILNECLDSLRKVASKSMQAGLPMPCTTAALSFLDGYRCARLPANLLQAQRDYFGAHTYERIDRPRGEFFHTNWTGAGGVTTSTSYDA